MNCNDGSTGSASATRPQNATGGRSLNIATWRQNRVARDRDGGAHDRRQHRVTCGVEAPAAPAIAQERQRSEAVLAGDCARYAERAEERHRQRERRRLLGRRRTRPKYQRQASHVAAMHQCRDEKRMHHAATATAAGRCQASQASAAQAISSKAHSCGSGMVGTVAWLTRA